MAKERTLFLVDYCLTPRVKIPEAGILCEGRRIIGIGGASAFSLGEEGLKVIQLPETYAMPGFIDCHVHADGIFTEDSPTGSENMAVLSRFLAAHAVTTFVPALRTVNKNLLLSRTAALAELVRKEYGGAYPFGIHLDGPFLNGSVESSHPVEFVSPIDLGYAKELIAAGQGKLKLLTFAPELPHADKLIELLLENGIIPSIGHSRADEATTLRAVDAGARRATDMFTVFPPLDCRESSVTDVILTDDRISMELIMDGSFLSGRAVEFSLRVKPSRKVIAISDSYSNCIKCLDFPALDSAWRNLKCNHPRIRELDACTCFNLNPAEDIGLFSRGELSPGKSADIVFFRCKDESLLATLVAGTCVYTSDPAILPLEPL